MKHSSPSFWLFVLLILLIVVPQLSCAPATPAQQGRQILEDAAEAMGGLAALNAIENIDRQGTRQVSSIGHGRLTTEPASGSSPPVPIIPSLISRFPATWSSTPGATSSPCPTRPREATGTFWGERWSPPTVLI